MKSIKWYKKKFEDIKARKAGEDDGEPAQTKTDEEMLREDFRTARDADTSYATDNLRKF